MYFVNLKKVLCLLTHSQSDRNALFFTKKDFPLQKLKKHFKKDAKNIKDESLTGKKSTCFVRWEERKMKMNVKKKERNFVDFDFFFLFLFYFTICKQERGIS